MSSTLKTEVKTVNVVKSLEWGGQLIRLTTLGYGATILVESLSWQGVQPRQAFDATSKGYADWLELLAEKGQDVSESFTFETTRTGSITEAWVMLPADRVAQ